MSSVGRAWAWAREVPESRVRWISTALVSLPLLVAIVALARRDWYPVLDLAMTEFRVRDVGTGETPLIGLPGRIGRLPVQGSHPGPLSFYLLAPTYRIFGSSSYGLEVGTVLLALVAIAASLWLAQRRGGRPMVLVVAVVLLVLIRGYGTDVLVQPWNPYLPLLFWVVVLLAAWSVLAGDRSMIVVLAAAGSLCAQTHVPYLGLVVGLVALCVVWEATRWIRHPLVRDDILRSWQLAAVVGVVLWIPVLIDQVTRTPGNVSLLREHFSNPTEPVVGGGEGFALLLRHLDVARIVGEALDGDAYFVRSGFDLTGSVAPGALFLVLWLVAAGSAVWLRDRRLVSLHAVLAASLVLGWVSMSRIFGKVWFYLTLWAWTTTVLMLVAVVWTAAAVLARSRPDRGTERSRAVWSAVASVTAIAGVVSLAVVTVEATDTDPPESHLSDTLGELVASTEESVRLGVGAADGGDGTYLVTFDDALHFGSQAYGLVNELERRGLDVGMVDHWRVPVTEHRVVSPLEATAELHLATGTYVDQWRARPDAVEVAYVEPRDADELAEYSRLEQELKSRLETDGLQDLVPMVTTNLFGLQLDSRVEPDVQRLVDAMLRLGQPTAVFIVPVTLGG